MDASKKSIAFCSVDFVGHAFPLLNLAEALAKRGHSCTFVVADYAGKDWKDKVAKAGCTLQLLQTGKAKSEMEMNPGGLIPFLYVLKYTSQSARDVLARLRPDLVVADFCTFAAMEAAEELGIPLVINSPSPYGCIRDFAGFPSPGTTRSLGGVVWGFNKFKMIELAKLLGVQGLDAFSWYTAKHYPRAVVLVNSFWGIEPAQPTPSTIVMTGALIPPAGDLTAKLQKEEPTLCAWLGKAGAKPVVFISTGSLAELHPWQVKAFFEGVKRAGLRAVWSLRKHLHVHLPNAEDEDFWISPWLPQAAILQDQAVKLVVYHCGWGGTMEVLQAGKPMVLCPFFADQPDIGRTLVAAGVGELIGPAPALSYNIENPWREGQFTADSVAEVLKRVASDPKYTQAAERMGRLSGTTLGANGAAALVEQCALNGTSHLVAPEARRSTGSNPFRGAIGVCLVGAAAGLCAVSHAAAAAVGLGGCLAGARAAARTYRPAAVAP